MHGEPHRRAMQRLGRTGKAQPVVRHEPALDQAIGCHAAMLPSTEATARFPVASAITRSVCRSPQAAAVAVAVVGAAIGRAKQPL